MDVIIYKKKIYSSHIPYELALSILSKLPLKSLKRFACVQKSWSLLFQNSHFMNMFQTYFLKFKSNEEYENISLLINFVKVNAACDTLSKLSGDRFEDMVMIDWPPPFEEDHQYMQMLGSSSVNGIICLYQDLDNESPTVLWNPATTEFKVLPPSFQPYEHIEFNPPPSAFGYDCVRDDYKVIRNVDFPIDSPNSSFNRYWLSLPEKDSPFWELLMDDDDKCWWKVEHVDVYDPLWEIYSLKNNSWRNLSDIDMPLPWSCRSQVNTNELCHFLDYKDKMFSFDFSNEKFILTFLPSDSNFEYLYEYQYLFLLNESVAFVYLDGKNDYHIWILGKFGVKESWTKLLILIHCDIGYPIGAWKNEIFFTYGHKIVRYNLSTKRSVEFETYAWKVIIYKEVILSIEGMKN